MGEKRCRHYELRIFPEKEPDLERCILPGVFPEFPLHEQVPKTTELLYVVLKGDITRKWQKGSMENPGYVSRKLAMESNMSAPAVDRNLQKRMPGE